MCIRDREHTVAENEELIAARKRIMLTVTHDLRTPLTTIKDVYKRQDYLKLNIFLSDLEYKFGYYVLMNRWQVPVIQKGGGNQ